MVCVGKPDGGGAPSSAADCLTDPSLWVAAPLVLTDRRAPAEHDAAAAESSLSQPPPATTQTLTVQLAAAGGAKCRPAHNQNSIHLPLQLCRRHC